jgi:hypothetical protein
MIWANALSLFISNASKRNKFTLRHELVPCGAVTTSYDLVWALNTSVPALRLILTQPSIQKVLSAGVKP